MTEREVLLTGIGGQGVQLAAQVLARAAMLEDRQVLLFGLYSGEMRGGSTESTVVVAEGPIESPPIVSRAWSAILAHHMYWEPVRRKLSPDAIVVVNSSLFEAELDRDGLRVFDVHCEELADERQATMVLVGAYAALTGLVTVDSVVEGMVQALPAYRRQHIPANEAAIRAGYQAAPAGAAPAWVPAAVDAAGARS